MESNSIESHEERYFEMVEAAGPEALEIYAQIQTLHSKIREIYDSKFPFVEPVINLASDITLSNPCECDSERKRSEREYREMKHREGVSSIAGLKAYISEIESNIARNGGQDKYRHAALNELLESHKILLEGMIKDNI